MELTNINLAGMCNLLELLTLMISKCQRKTYLEHVEVVLRLHYLDLMVEDLTSLLVQSEELQKV